MADFVPSVQARNYGGDESRRYILPMCVHIGAIPPGRSSCPSQDERARLRSGVAAVNADLRIGDLCSSLPAKLPDDFEDVGDSEHVGLAEHPPVGVVGQAAAVEMEPVTRDERSAFALRAEPHVL